MSVLLGSARAFGHAHPYHEHEDLFGEEDLLLGFKAGPQVTSFTQYRQGNANVVPQSRMRAVFGGDLKFVYDLPRFELGFLWNVRGWINTEDSVNFLSMPLVVKFPVVIDKGVELELGPGIQPEVAIGSGLESHRTIMMGVLGALGVSIDYKQFVVDLELRYNVGLNSVSDAYPGSKNRDLEAIAGMLWHF